MDSVRAAFGQFLLGLPPGLDPLGQLGFLLGVEPGHLADLLQVVLDRVHVDRVRGRRRFRVRTEPSQETGAPGDGLVSGGVLFRQVFAELRVEIGHEQVVTVPMCACAGGHDAAPFPLSVPNG